MGWTVLRFAAAFGVVSVFVSAAQAASYPAMAPVNQYMMNRAEEVALAKSAAPPSISGTATILVLTPHGYETAVQGSNGFVCAVERGWMSQYDFPQFWNPHVRGPLCYNPAAVRTILPYTIRRTELVLAGHSKSEMSAAIKAGIEKHTLPPLEAGALTFMLSKQQYLNDKGQHWMPHLMFYFPRGEAAKWGAGLAGSPTILNPQFQDSPEAISVILVPVAHWSDGTPAPKM
ncbi:MAG TPA: hypothetical protein VHU18_13510 [Rhizomicrobium sp.]|jgi:hypothetical protein|nr:hypothetical protein [Rhizomicrobium sp.]